MKNNTGRVFIGIFILLSLKLSFPAPSEGDDTRFFHSLDADQQFKYAEHCFANRNFQEALFEFKRFIYFFPDDKRVEIAMYRTGMSFFHLGQYEKAIDALEHLIDRFAHAPLSVNAYQMISESHLKLNNTAQAIISLFNLIAVSGDQAVKDDALYRIGWVHIETAEWEKARSAFEKISTQNRSRYAVEDISTELEKEKRLTKKNPGLAGFLSLFPGAGYLYCERYQDAFMAFIINGAMIYAASEAFDRDNPALGVLLSAAGFSFYAGSIYGTVASAHKYNRNRTDRFIEKLKAGFKIGLSPSFEKRGLALTVHVSY
ncbi:MAG: tetratricopeptide repeat protein [Pseudomonadota bacterium]